LANDADNPKRIPPQNLGGMTAQPEYTQVNILFPATQVELPPAEKFSAFPPDAQRAILDAFKTEQLQRHTWLRNQQHNDHQLNTLIQANYFRWRISALFCAALLALSVLVIGAILVAVGAPIVGVTLLISAVAGLVGTAIYGHRLNAPQESPEESEK
jgi:hypothetical protein